MCQYGNVGCAADLCRTDCGGQCLERSEEELGLTKRQLEESKGKQYLVYIVKKKFGYKVIGSSWICQGPRPKW